MQQITAPEILWKIFTLVESNADLARAGCLNKFIGAAALDVLWNDIPFGAFLSLLPTQRVGRDQDHTVCFIKAPEAFLIYPLEYRGSPLSRALAQG